MTGMERSTDSTIFSLIRLAVSCFTTRIAFFDGAGFGSAVTDQDVTVHAEQRRAAVFLPVVGRVDLLHDRVELIDELGGGFLDLGDDRAEQSVGHAFGEFQDDVSDEAVEKMLEESLEHAFEDMSGRVFTEDKLKSDELLPAVRTALQKIGNQLTAEEHAQITAAVAEVEAALAAGEPRGS